MIISNNKNTYAKFTKESNDETHFCYVPVYCWKVHESAVTGLVPSIGSFSGLLEVQTKETDGIYGEFQYYIDESQIEADKAESSAIPAYVFPFFS